MAHQYCVEVVVKVASLFCSLSNLARVGITAFAVAAITVVSVNVFYQSSFGIVLIDFVAEI